MNPEEHWKALPPHGPRCSILVWVCALVWSALSGLLVLGAFFDYCFAHGLGHGFMGLIYPAQAIGLLPGYLLSMPGCAALLATMPVALIGAAIYSFRR